MGFYHLQTEHYFNKKCIVETDIVNDVMHMHQMVSNGICSCFLCSPERSPGRAIVLPLALAAVSALAKC